MHKALLSVSLWMLSTGCSALFDLRDVQIVDAGSGHSADARVDSAMPDSAMADSAMRDSAMADSTMADSAMADSAMPDSAMADSAMADSAMMDRRYQCGYAAPGNHCDNRRRSQNLIAPDMAEAIATCKKQKPKPDLDFCYVKDDDGLAAMDESQCMAASGSWRPEGNCCNFLGAQSCPASP